MPKMIAPAKNSIDTRVILNTARQYASAEYRDLIPDVGLDANGNPDYKSVVRVGETLFGSPNLLNEFVNLINRIAMVVVKSMDFNNPLRFLKKGYLEFGESVEEIFVNIAKAHQFDPENAPKIELANWAADVRSAFHVKNWSAQYRVSVSEDQLKYAFTSYDGVSGLMDRMIQSMYTGMEYDEYLLIKYMVIKAITHGEVHVVTKNITNPPTAAMAGTLRGMSNQLEFPSTEYNRAHVLNNTPRSRQVVIMDSEFAGMYDATVLAGLFNMDRATFDGRHLIIDSFTSFDNDRFAEFTQGQLEPITEDELALMEKVRVFQADELWFQIYDYLIRFEAKRVASALRWNNFLTKQAGFSTSPYHNAIVYIEDSTGIAAPTTLTATIVSKDNTDLGAVFGVSIEATDATLADHTAILVYSEAAAQQGAGITPEGIISLPSGKAGFPITAMLGGKLYTASASLTAASAVGATFQMSPA